MTFEIKVISVVGKGHRNKGLVEACELVVFKFGLYYLGESCLCSTRLKSSLQFVSSRNPREL